jgi:hypothetical protein
MSRNQRLTFLGIAALIAVVAIVVFALAGSDDTSEQADNPPAATETATPSATATGEDASTPEPTPTETATPKPQPPLLTAGSVKKLSYKEGETVTFRVRHDQPEEVHVHGYDIKKDLEPGKTETVSFKADITGIFDIELHSTDEQIGQLRVDPS